MDIERIDVPAVKTRINELREEIRAKKNDGYRGGELFSEKREATLLCTLQAHRRGKLHMTKCKRWLVGWRGFWSEPKEVVTAEDQEKILRKYWDMELEKYEREEVPIVEPEPLLAPVGAITF